ncbi:aldehyde dehydrogenase family protein [Bradyrhizobium sp. 1.29L]
MDIYQNYIAGRWVPSAKTLDVINPSDGSKIAEIARGGASEIDAAVAAGHAARKGSWGKMDAVSRGRLLFKMAELIRRDGERLAKLESEDVGKPMKVALADVAGCARYFEYYGGAVDKVYGETIPLQNGVIAMTLYEPHGVTAHIVPWNYPLQITGRSVVPSLAMGNSIVLKPAEDTSLTALALAKLAEEAGFPPGVFNVVTGLGEEAGAALSTHPGIGHISFTGSRDVGRLIQVAAAKNTIPVTLELGGKSPQVVFSDAPLDEAGATIVRSIAHNSGQTCSAGSRVLIQDEIYDQFTSQLAKRFNALRVGSASQDLDLGPVVNAAQQSRIESYLDMARRDRLPILGEGSFGTNLPTGGYYVKPTFIADVPEDHALAQEEIFGPVLVALRFRNEDDAIRIANDTPYGLSAGIWTSDLGRSMRLSRSIESGQVFVNNYGVGSGVEVPFGGVKGSGFGREKAMEALYGFGVLKTVVIRHDS